MKRFLFWITLGTGCLMLMALALTSGPVAQAALLGGPSLPPPIPTVTRTVGLPPPVGTATRTPLPTATLPHPVGTVPVPTPCTLTFQDVPVGSPFEAPVRCLVCQGILGGYPCGGNPLEPCVGPANRPYFRPGNSVTRGQIAKIVSSAAHYEDTPTAQSFEDVAPTNTFYLGIERLASRGLIGGYPCGGNPLEPCVGPANRPYFRPNHSATRGQIAKIVANAIHLTTTPAAQTFEDVPPTNSFYVSIEQVASLGIISGYPCGGENTPCIAPDNRPYFRPNSPTTRGQLAKIVSNTFFPACNPPLRR